MGGDTELEHLLYDFYLVLRQGGSEGQKPAFDRLGPSRIEEQGQGGSEIAGPFEEIPPGCPGQGPQHGGPNTPNDHPKNRPPCWLEQRYHSKGYIHYADQSLQNFSSVRAYTGDPKKRNPSHLSHKAPGAVEKEIKADGNS